MPTIVAGTLTPDAAGGSAGSGRCVPDLPRQPLDDPIQRRLPFEADARPVRQGDGAALDLGVVGEPAERAKDARIGLGAAEAEAGRDRERHLVAAVRE